MCLNFFLYLIFRGGSPSLVNLAPSVLICPHPVAIVKGTILLRQTLHLLSTGDISHDVKATVFREPVLTSLFCFDLGQRDYCERQVHYALTAHENQRPQTDT